MAEKSGLSTLTIEQIREAFEKARDEADIKEGRLTLVTEDMYDDVLKFGQQTFGTSEPISMALGLQDCPDFLTFWRAYLRTNLSIVLINETNGDIMGMRIIGISRADKKSDADAYEFDGFKKLIRFCTHCDQGANFFDHYGVTETVHFLGLSVGDNYRKMGLGSKIMAAAIGFIGHLGLDSVCIKGEGSSNFSKRIYEKNGFDTLSEKPYAEYLEDGKPVICGTGIHKSMKMYGRRITKS